LYSKREIKRRGDTSKEHAVSPSKLIQSGGGYKEVSLGRSIREKEIYQKPRVYPQASCDKADGYPKKLKLYPKRKIKRKGDTSKEHAVSPSKL